LVRKSSLDLTKKYYHTYLKFDPVHEARDSLFYTADLV